MPWAQAHRREWISTAIVSILLFVVTSRSSAEMQSLEAESFRLEVNETSPNLRLFGRWPSGRIYRDEHMSVLVIGVDEYSTWSSSTPIRSLRYDAPTTRYNLTRLKETVPGLPVLRDYLLDRVAYVDGSNSTVDLEAGIVNASYTVMLAGHEVPVRPNTLKFSITCRQFPFLQNTVRLRFLLEYEFFAPPLSVAVNSRPSGDGTILYLNASTPNLLLQLALQQFASSDGQYVKYGFTQPNLIFRSDSLAIQMGFDFPRFTNEFIYDPDFSVLLLIPDPAENANAPGAAGIQGDLPTWVVAPIVVCVVVVAAIIAAVVFILKSRKKRQASAHVHQMIGKLALAEEKGRSDEPFRQQVSIDTGRPQNSVWKAAAPTDASLSGSQSP